jgi:16S rRNA (uracil1498-N3)-methyltransferase
MHRFFAQSLTADECVLAADDSKHLCKVLRARPGEQVEVSDGQGKLYLAEVKEANPRQSKLQLLQVISSEEKRYGIHIACAPTKNMNRYEFFLEKAVELGVDRITPVICQHSERRKINKERSERIIREAAKQSRKIKLPAFSEAIHYQKFIASAQAENKYIAHCQQNDNKHSLSEIKKGNDSLILIGPEGDFSSEEIQKSTEQGFQQVSLSESRLRTETAAIIAVHLLHL